MGRAWLLAALLVAIPPAVAAAQEDSVAAARDLYTTAAYEDALAMLDRLAARQPASRELPAIEQYRAYALIALGRMPEAEQAIERIVAADPSWELPEGEAPPRIAAIFTSVRERVVPNIVRQRIEAARALYNDKQYAEAAEAFTGVITLLKEPSIARAMGSEVSALETVATGFRDLALAADEQARIAAEQAASAASAPAASTAGAPDTATGQATVPGEEEPASGSAITAAAPAAPGDTSTATANEGREPSANSGDSGTRSGPATATPGAEERTDSSPLPPGVVPPKVITQQIPRPSDMAVPLGEPTVIVLEVVIDEIGRVERTNVARSVNPAYEAQLSAAARHWRYVPATQNGRPIKFVKTLAITLAPR